MKPLKINMKLKFRARVKQDGKPFLFYQNDQYLISFLRRVTAFIKYEADDQEAVHESYLTKSLDEYLEMATGEQDEEGREVYRGDIVEYMHISSDGIAFENNQVGEIIWAQAGFVIKTKYWFSRGVGTEQRELIAVGPGIIKKIIGNTHLNPKLAIK